MTSRVRYSSFLGLVLLVALAALLPFVYASRPESSAHPGLYDAADWDDVVSFLADTSAIASPTIAPLGVVLQVRDHFIAVSGLVLLPPQDLAYQLRAPPAA